MAVAAGAFHMRVVLEIIHRQFAMAFEEAGGDGPAAQRALDAEGDLRLVGALHHHAAACRLDDRGVVELDALAARQRGFAVGVDRGDPEVGVAPRHDQEKVARAARLGFLRAVEIGDRDRARDIRDGLQGGAGRRVGLLPRQVEMRVVHGQRQVGQHRDGHAGEDDRRRIGTVRPGRQPRLERQAQRGGIEAEHRGQPSGGPQQHRPVDRLMFHRVSAAPGPAPRGTGPAG